MTSTLEGRSYSHKLRRTTSILLGSTLYYVIHLDLVFNLVFIIFSVNK